MRDIKFRAWNGIELRQVDQITISQKTWSCESGYGVSIPYMPHIILMQYTGLKDKDGKEIYEGDILQDTLTNMIYVVKFGFCKKYAFNGWYVEIEHHQYQTTINGDYDTNTNSKIEVIGNIYENPELITP
jgi:uncharacterized phage protein (TIGR01671 family)